MVNVDAEFCRRGVDLLKVDNVELYALRLDCGYKGVARSSLGKKRTRDSQVLVIVACRERWEISSMGVFGRRRCLGINSSFKFKDGISCDALERRVVGWRRGSER